MIVNIIRGVSCLVLFIALQQIFVAPACADEKQEQIQLLQKKMQKLQELMTQLEELKASQAPPTAPPWEKLAKTGAEWPGYQQYAYLLAPQLRGEDLDAVLQQLHFFAGRDAMEERGTLFVIPAVDDESAANMRVEDYSRALAIELVQTLNSPTAIEAWLVVSPAPLTQSGIADGPLLVIDLAGSDRMLRARIFELLQQQQLYTEDGSFADFIWQLLNEIAPQPLKLSMDGKRLRLSSAEE